MYDPNREKDIIVDHYPDEDNYSEDSCYLCRKPKLCRYQVYSYGPGPGMIWLCDETCFNCYVLISI